MARDFWCDTNLLAMILCTFAVIVIIVVHIFERRGGDK